MISHNRTVVRECSKHDEGSQWKKPKFDPLATPKPLNQSSSKLACVIRHAKFRNDRFLLPKYVILPCHGVTSFCSFFFWGGYFNKATAYTPLNGFLRKIRQMTSFQVSKCLLGVPITKFDIYTLIFPKNRHFGDRFRLDSFFAAENCFDMGCSNKKLPFIVVVAP